MDTHTTHKMLIAPLRQAMYNFDGETVRTALREVMAPDVTLHMCCPFGDMTGPDALYDHAYAPLLAAWPDLERRDWIVMAGTDDHGHDWVGCGGYYTGTFTGPWLDIPPTGHQAHMRFHEFYRVVDGKIAEVQTIWDIPEVMMQANAWPLAPSLGREWHVPGPATQDGFVPGPYDEARSKAACDHVVEMLKYLVKFPSQGGPEVMEPNRFWHPRMNWYGPAGIGTARGFAGFRNWHQIPFLNAMPDRGKNAADLISHFFADSDYVGVTGWPNMRQSLTESGWLGIAPNGKRISLRSLDFWRMENGLIRENWVLVDLLDVYAQIGVDVFARLREFNKARNLTPISIPDGMTQ